MLKFLLPFLAALLLSAGLIFLAKDFFLKIFRAPFGGRHIQNKFVPRGGGVIVIAVFLFLIFFNPDLIFDKALLGLAASVFIILLYGILDDVFDLKVKWQFLFQIAAVLPVILSGIRIDLIRNPLAGFFGFGEAIRFDQIELFGFSLFGSLIIFGWLLILMNAMNFLDGVDGLAGGVSFLAFAAVFAVSLSAAVNQPAIAILAAILGGAVLGFLVFNFPPAKIFFGTSGSIFLGFIAGVLAVYSGAKIATASLVLVLPLLDSVFVVIRRLKDGVSIFQADNRHSHHKFLAAGFTQKQILLFYCSFAALLGVFSLFATAFQKFTAIFILILIAGAVSLAAEKSRG
ncbi:MAG: MraY family glycosyltransferase [Patescibacteria group bacterium]